jgi:hypothetical protein
MDQITAKNLFDYDPETGNLIYRYKPYGKHKKRGDTAGTPQPNGYRMVMVKRKRYLIHRLVWLWHHGWMPKRPMVLDHIDRNRSNNRIENLRVVSVQENLFNVDYSKTTSKTGYRGVCWLPERGKYLAYFVQDGKRVHIGHFDDPHTAAEAYNQKILELRGDMVDLNTIRSPLPQEFRKPVPFEGLVDIPDWLKWKETS